MGVTSIIGRAGTAGILAAATLIGAPGTAAERTLAQVGADSNNDSGTPKPTDGAAAAGKFVDAVARLSALYECKTCDGGGTTIERKKTGEKSKGVFKHKTYKNEEIDCPRCEGTGYADADVLVPRLEDAARALADVPRGDERVDQRVNAMRERLREVIKLDPEALGKRINAAAAEHINNRAAGQPIVFARVADEERKRTGKPPSPTFPYIAGYDIEVYLDNPRLTQADLTGDLLIGGVLSFDDAGRPMVSRGFVVGAR